MKASPGRGKLSPQVTDEGAGRKHFTLNTPHPALRATYSPFCRYATFSPGAGEICPQGVKALAPDQAAKMDFSGFRMPSAVLWVYSAERLFCICKEEDPAGSSSLLFHGEGRNGKRHVLHSPPPE